MTLMSWFSESYSTDTVVWFQNKWLKSVLF